MNNTVFKINKFNGKSLVINDLNNYLNSSNEYKVKDIERLLSSYGYSNEFYKTSSKALLIDLQILLYFHCLQCFHYLSTFLFQNSSSSTSSDTT